MGAANVTCEPPCSCALHLEGYDPSERVSITAIKPLQVSLLPGQRDSRAHRRRVCVLRVDVHCRERGPRCRFMLSDLISGSTDPGPITWAFDVAGKMLLH